MGSKTKESLYLHIADTLRKKIRKGDYGPGVMLPSQKELSTVFKTTVMTVRQALSLLEKEGLVSMVHGLGTFVASGDMKGRDFRLQGFSDEMERHRVSITTRVLNKEYSCRISHVQHLLGTGDKPCCCLTRLRFLGDTPIILQRSYVSSEYRNVVKEYEESASLYECLHKVSGGVVEGREIIVPILLGAEEAALLGEKEKSAGMVSYRASFNISHTVILFDEAVMTGTNVLLSVRQTGRQHLFNYSIIVDERSAPFAQLLNPAFWEET